MGDDDERELGETGKEPAPDEPWAKSSSGRDPHEDDEEEEEEEEED